MLTKTLFVQGMNCPALMWYLANEKQALPEPTEADKAIMEQGIHVGELAQDRYPEGLGIRGKPETAALLTKRLLARGVPLYEATFIHDELLCKTDILVPEDDGYKLVEVKSSTRVKDDHLLDIAFQTHVLRRAGLDVKSAYLCHINRSYERQGPLELDELFAEEDVTEQLTPILETIDDDITRLLNVIKGPKPTLSGHPHGCALDDFVDLPEHNVTELYRNNGEEHLKNGIQRITDVPEGLLTKKQRVQVQAITTGQPVINHDKLKHWLDQLEEPLIHLDFETINPAIPPYDGLHPYDQLPFQFSAHIENGVVDHVEYLGDGTTDPRPGLVKALTKLPEGTYLAHNANFEKRVLKSLQRAHPQHADKLRKIEQSMHDTIVPFRNFWYYHPDQHGSCSIKAILPALTGRGYDDLAISDGGLAQVKYAQLQTASEEEAAQIREDLLAYCKLDTEGMVEILNVLKKSV